MYFFSGAGSSWSLDLKFTGTSGSPSDFLGNSVALDGDYVIAGALLDDAAGHNAGAAYVFERQAGIWSLAAKLTEDDGSGGDDHKFQVVAQASDACDRSPTVVAEINGTPVLDAQTVVIKLNNGKERVRIKHGLVEFETARATLTVTATDAVGNVSTQQVVLDKVKDDDDDPSDD